MRTLRALILFGCVVVVAVLIASGQRVQAACPSSPTTYGNGAIEGPIEESESLFPTVAVDGSNRFIAAYETRLVNGRNRIFVARFNADGSCLCNTGDTCPAPVVSSNAARFHHASICIQRITNPSFRLVWEGGINPVIGPNDGGDIYSLTYGLLTSSFGPSQQGAPGINHLAYYTPSGGLSDSGGVCGDGWGRIAQSGSEGVAYRAVCAASASNFVESCDTASSAICFTNVWQPGTSMRADGASAQAWAHPVDNTDLSTAFDIQIQEFSSSGGLIGSDVMVNQPVRTSVTSESSAATAFRDTEVLAVWVGPTPQACSPSGRFRVYARRMRWDGSGTIDFVGDQFIVDSDLSWNPISQADANPTVAIHPTSDEFIVGWNVVGTGANDEVWEIHAQYFRFDGDCVRPIGGEFRVNQDTSYTDTDDGSPHLQERRLAESGQHTCAYRVDGGVVFAWQRGVMNTTPNTYFTILPAGYANDQAAVAPCAKGDCNHDADVNGDDIYPFEVALIDATALTLPTYDCHSLVENCPFDTNYDGIVSVDDVPPFICLLLGLPGNCNGGTVCFGAEITDCNDNAIDDQVEIHLRSTADCNSNGLPDECDIALSYSADANENGVPDECDPADCNDNGIDDLIDIAEETSADCNLNSWPDECEPDCNDNGVPDDCDIDPTDPDGDSVVYPDCNNSSLPDECDFELPLHPSYDCNENGIPDECDIASEYSEDANENGIPDECDYELGRSEGESAVDQEAAWLAFYEWQIDAYAALSAMSQFERFEATVGKLHELGLPDAIPWARVSAP